MTITNSVVLRTPPRRQRGRGQRQGIIASLLLVALSTSSHAFQPSMAPSSSKSLHQPRLPFFPPTPFGGIPPPPLPFDLSSNLISQLAVMALKIRLAGHTDVSCDVTANSSDLLLNGRVGPVTVKGKGWRSSKGLTCRAIEATVDHCQLDVGRILSKRKLTLTKPAHGKAKIALNCIDFGNFISHPLMKPPMVSSGQTVSFVHNTERTNIDPTTGTVTFFAKCAGVQWKCVLQRGGGGGSSDTAQQKRARITVLLDDNNNALDLLPNSSNTNNNDDHYTLIGKELTHALTDFFNQMVFELDGTFLSFRDMMVTDRGESPCVMLSLNIHVHKFPSRGLEF